MATLFDHLARSGDPRTSRTAARELVESGLLSKRAQEALDALKRYPGFTAAELEQEMGVRDGRIRKRLAGLKEAGKAEKGVPRRCQVTGKTAFVWFPSTGERIGS